VDAVSNPELGQSAYWSTGSWFESHQRTDILLFPTASVDNAVSSLPSEPAAPYGPASMVE
jgi:hypothetical protein